MEENVHIKLFCIASASWTRNGISVVTVVMDSERLSTCNKNHALQEYYKGKKKLFSLHKYIYTQAHI